MLDLARDLRSAGLQRARGMADWQGLHHDLEQLARRLRLACGAYPTGTRLNWTEAVPQGVTSSDWIEVLDGLNQVCAQACESLVAVLDMTPDFVRLHERTLALRAQVQRFATPSQIEGVRWVEVGLQVRLVEAPLDLAPVVQGWLQLPDAAQPHPGATQAAPTRAWVFTSATLGTDEALSWFTEPLGLDQARTLRVPSPFDLERQAALYIPRDLPPPTDAAHSAALGEWVAEAASRLQGRTLVLTTSLRALRVLGEALRARLPGLQVLVQGEGTRHSLMERFRQGSALGAPGCVLVASVSFWEGWMCPAMRCSWWSSTNCRSRCRPTPWCRRTRSVLRRAGRSPFRDHALPEAAVALKQGAGRLIRHETDGEFWWWPIPACWTVATANA
jgi:ATP-dependent DNA helicase DinG